MAEIEASFVNGEDKMKAVASSNPGLQVSVSFGRFENDSLSWEKFSSFSPNKYLEEVEKCATPGSVAQKKAYFEAHYKKIAERKAELMDQEKQVEKKASLKSSVENNGDPKGENSGPLADSGLNGEPDGQCAREEDKHVTDISTGVNERQTNKLNEEPMVVVKECQSLLDDGKEEAGDRLDDAKLEESEEVVQVKEKLEKIVLVQEEEEKAAKAEVKEETLSKGLEDMKETTTKELKEEKDNHLTKAKERNVRMNRTGDSPKVSQVSKKPVTNKTVTSKSTPPRKERSMTMTTTKPASPVSRAPGFSTPRVSRPTSAFTSMSTSVSRLSTKKENVSTLTRNKQMGSKSLHMSLSLDPPGSDPTALTTTRKTLIMERMGDKDIVKRAFKTFQKSFDQLKPSTDGQNTVPKQQVPAKTTKVSALATPQKENGRSAKAGGTEKKSARSYPSSFGLKSINKAEKQKEFPKISGEKSGARAAERTRLLAKPKRAEVMDVKTRRHNLDPKAKTMHSSLILVQNLSKGSSD